MQECSLQTEIRTLGPCKLDSVLPYRTWADNKTVQIVVDEELSEEVGAPFSVCLEAAGPRKKLYFDTTRAKCAIVTCGGPHAAHRHGWHGSEKHKEKDEGQGLCRQRMPRQYSPVR